MPESVTGADKVAALLTRPLVTAIEAGETAIAAEGQALLAAYPGASGKAQPPRSAAQRRAIFALIRAGKIPYKRSGDLGRGWQIVRQGSMRVALVNRQKHAKLVQGPDQAGYHKGTWKNVIKVRAALLPRVIPLMREAIDGVFK